MSTSDFELVGSAATEAATVADLAQKAAGAEKLDTSEVYLVADGKGGHRVVDTDEYGLFPRRAKSNRVVNDAATFVSYFGKHSQPYSEVWASTKQSTVVGVIDAHEGADSLPGWEGHRVTLQLEKSLPWLAWEKFDGQWFAQLDFAEFIEVRASDVRVPDAAFLLELAQHFSAARSVDFESSEKMADGQTKLTYHETVTAKAGQKGSLEIPERLQLVLKPYIGGPAYFVWARFRYRLNGANLALGYVLERPQEILDAAFVDIVAEIRDGKPETAAREATESAPSVIAQPGHPGIAQPIFYGRP